MIDAAQIAFDATADTYDADFTQSVIGRLQREQLWRIYDRLFQPRARLLDLGCGTGEDVLRFARLGHEVEGVDLSPEMTALAEQRIATAGLEDSATVWALPLERLDELPERGFAGAYSSFSPLNCVAELRPVAQALAKRMDPGAPLALCLMSRYCLWETVLYPLTWLLHRSARRSQDGWVRAAAGRGELRLVYHRIGEVRSAFAPWFELLEAPGLSVFAPPSYLEPWAQRWPRATRALARLDQQVAGWPLLRLLADHRVVVLRRRPAPAVVS